jgi:sugar/nucleoside kinase (ribokinase family)
LFFSIGYFDEDEHNMTFEEALATYGAGVSEVYFPWPGLRTCRNELPPDGASRLLAGLKAAKSAGKALCLLINANCYAGRAISKEFARASPSKLIVADSRINIDQYTDVVVKCNNFEAASIAGYAGEKDEFNLAEVFASIDKIRRYTGKPVVVTCNKHGIAIVENGEYKLLPAVTHDCPIDICGAGDACTAGFVSTLAAGGSYAEAAFIGNLSSGVTVRQIGCTGTATQKAMMALYDEQFGE